MIYECIRHLVFVISVSLAGCTPDLRGFGAKDLVGFFIDTPLLQTVKPAIGLLLLSE